MEHAERLTSTERKIAEVLAGEPQTIAFGTVAQVAQRAGTSGPSVVRLAVKLGYDGFVGLQADVQSELARQLGPARDRIRQRPPTDFLARVAGRRAGQHPAHPPRHQPGRPGPVDRPLGRPASPGLGPRRRR